MANEETNEQAPPAQSSVETQATSSSPHAPDHSQTPPQIPDHELLLSIGKGSYGEVWLARSKLGTLRAVKLVYRSTFKDSRPFEREFKGIQKFEPVSRSHEGLVDILQVGGGEEYFYYVMELADAAKMTNDEIQNPKEARNLNDETSPATLALRASSLVIPSPFDIRHSSLYIPRTLGYDSKQRGRLPVKECVNLGHSLASALAHLHAEQLVHRDIKPSNIIFVGGVPKLADIGLVADMSAAPSYVGTEGFIPPEGPGKPQADIYSLGKVLYEISTGKDRHDFPDLPADLRDSTEQSGFSEMNEIILKACASDVAQRYRSAEEMQADLSILQQGKSVKQKRVHERRWILTRRAGFGAMVLAALVGVLLPLQSQWQAQRPMHPKALKLYTDGQAYLRKGATKDLDEAIRLLEQALAFDQNHPKIHAALARAYETKFFLYAPTDRELDVKAGHALERARQLGPKLPETHFAQGYRLWYRPDGKGWQHKPTITSFRRATEANPQENPMLAAESHQQLAGIYLHIGLMDEALGESKKALEIDSVQSRVHFAQGMIALYRGDYQQAEGAFRRAEMMEAGFNQTFLALACFKQGKVPETKNIIENALKDSPTDSGGQFASVEAMLFARAGEVTLAKEAARRAEESGKGYGHFHHTAYNLGCAYALMNHPDDAVRWLRTAADTGFPCYPAFQSDPTLANISGDSRFLKFLDEQRDLWMDHKEFVKQLDAKSRM